MPPLLSAKVVLVTGAGSGIGQATALTMAREGASVVIADRDEAAGTATLEMITGQGGRGLTIIVDTSQARGVETLVRRAVDCFGRVDCAVNNAAVRGPVVLTAEHTEENWDRIVSTNLKGVWLCMKFEIGQMLRQGGGAIVNIASNFGLVGSPGRSAYSASKHGVIGLTKAAALEYARRNIRVNAVCPGPTRTPFMESMLRERPEVLPALEAAQPIGRVAQSSEIAEAVVWLCSERASFVNGASLPVDGGFVAQ
ncbi:MAG TPA: glucose 1-dehydrogenase [Candidatus Binataceae bacterium]|nr:glucose 1-dehydrogenase [Candidatus Binataceae bacterium]